ncbi:hypothetical protein KGF86_15650 [Ornithinibacillus massiliensis]|uniref:Uncharacterized protein n=1 Tax=Ornithinibacillus massiliensis TaxID=1944633 RepID=A0ABS5MHS8_9BACI|nr:hypothetical protein [Ornithinibacillus massiliensis]MBS3681628.1 hypothetical protein [Ornithinibacillus massiliensis]
MGNTKLAVVYLLLFVGVFGLLNMVLGFTDFSFIKTILFIGGIVLLYIAIHKQKSIPQYVEAG